MKIFYNCFGKNKIHKHEKQTGGLFVYFVFYDHTAIYYEPISRPKNDINVIFWLNLDPHFIPKMLDSARLGSII